MKIRASPFLPHEKDKIRREYLTVSRAQLARDLKCSSGKVKNFLDKHKLEVPESIHQRNRQTARFKKGFVPSNKNDIGDITVRSTNNGRQYKFIKISETETKLYQRYVWENVNGEIPEGYIIAFKDGDSLNCDPDNLKIISKVEHVLTYSINNHPKELIPTMTLISQINNKINKIESEQN